MSLESSISTEQAASGLSRLLTRLEQKLLYTPESDPTITELKSSKYQRARVGSNIEHARLLLLQIDSVRNALGNGNASSSSKISRPFAWPTSRITSVHTSSQTVSLPSATEIKKQKTLIVKLQRRLDELGRSGHDEAKQKNGEVGRKVVGVKPATSTAKLDNIDNRSTLSGGGVSDFEADARKDDERTPDILGVYYPEYLKFLTVSSTDESSNISARKSRKKSPSPAVPDQVPAKSSAQTPDKSDLSSINSSSMSTLRSRQPVAERRVDGKAMTTGAEVSPWKPKQVDSGGKGLTDDKNATTQLLETHEDEQTALTTSLLLLASELKTSTQAFSADVNDSNPLVDHATAALNANMDGMDGASSRMKMLRRMTEGKGWWDRLGLWARVGILWIALILVWAVIPPLRIF